MSFATAVDARIKAMFGALQQIKLGRIASAQAPVPGILGRVWVSGIAEQPVSCDWSKSFELEMQVPGADLTGALVEVHVIDGQNIVAHTITIGDK